MGDCNGDANVEVEVEMECCCLVKMSKKIQRMWWF